MCVCVQCTLCFAELQIPFFVCCAGFVSSQQHHGKLDVHLNAFHLYFFRTYYYYMLRCLFLFCFEPNSIPYTQILEDMHAHHKTTRAFLDFITSCWAAILLLFDTIRCTVCLYTRHNNTDKLASIDWIACISVYVCENLLGLTRSGILLTVSTKHSFYSLAK